MLTSISPLGERARGNSWWLTIGWLTAGTVIGGAALGHTLGKLGQFLSGTDGETWRLVTIALAGVAGAVWDITGRRFPGHRQVNKDWLSVFRPWVYGIGYGLQLGAAVTTVVNTALIPMFMLAALLTYDTISGLVIGAVFGLVRGLSVTINFRVRNAHDLRGLHRRLDGMAGQARLLSSLAMVLLAGASIFGLVA